MRISDWSSDVCSSDLQGGKGRMAEHRADAAQCLSDGFRCRRVVPGGGGTVANSQPGQAEQQHGQGRGDKKGAAPAERSEEHTSELQSLMRISYAVFCLKKKKTH